MPKKIFSNNEIELIIKLYTEEGYTQEEIAKKLDCCTKKPIARILKEYNIPTITRRINRRLQEDYFQKIDSENTAYLIGLLFADGNVTISSDNHQPLIKLQLLNEDINLLNFFKQELRADSEISDCKDGTYSFCVRSAQLAKDLAKYNIIPNKTYLINNFPNIPNEYICHFLRGYIDGDGSLYFSDNHSFHLSITTHSLTLANEFKKIVYDLLNVPEKTATRKVTFYNNVAKFTLNGKEAFELANLLYNNANIYCSRKYDKYLQAKNYY